MDIYFARFRVDVLALRVAGWKVRSDVKEVVGRIDVVGFSSMDFESLAASLVVAVEEVVDPTQLPEFLTTLPSSPPSFHVEFDEAIVRWRKRYGGCRWLPGLYGTTGSLRRTAHRGWS